MGSKNRDGVKSSARDIIGEVARETPKHYKHLTEAGLEPKPPRSLHGVEAESLAEWYERELVPQAEAQYEEYARRDGTLVRRRQRMTTTVLGATVVGFDTAPSPHDRRYKHFEERVVAWARKKYGRKLVGVYAHDDEPHGHIHILFADEGRQIKQSMDGHAAALFSVQQGEPRATAKERLVAANERLQNEFQEEVGKWVGLARKGPTPERGRKSRARYLREKLKAQHEGELSAMQLAMKKALELKDMELEQERARRHLAERAQANLAEALSEWIERKRRFGEIGLPIAEDLRRLVQTASMPHAALPPSRVPQQQRHGLEDAAPSSGPEFD